MCFISFISSSSLAEVDTGSTSQNGSNIAQTPEPAVGACQIKNGIIKIRLSKLIDNKKDIGDNDYEVTLCESDALIGCKKLSVPLSPLAPAVYSAYCENLKIKKKNHSKKSKKKGRKNGTLKTAGKNVEKNKMEIDTYSELNSSDFCELQNSNKTESKLPTFDSDKNEITPETKTDEHIVPRKTETPDPNLCCSTDSQNIDNSNLSCEMINDRILSSNVNSDSFAVEPSDSHSSFTQNISQISELSPQVPSQTMRSELMCSINLTLLDRIPKRYLSAELLSESGLANVTVGKEVKEESIPNSVNSNLINVSNFNPVKNSSIIKKERYTPPVCELSRVSKIALDR